MLTRTHIVKYITRYYSSYLVCKLRSSYTNKRNIQLFVQFYSLCLEYGLGLGL